MNLNSGTDSGASLRPRPVAPAQTFAQELAALLESVSGSPITLGKLMETTQGRGIHFLLILITLPFVTPVPLPGISLPFGFLVAILGIRMALNQKAWLPSRLSRWPIPPGFLIHGLSVAVRVVGLGEWVLRPRWTWLTDVEGCRRLAGLLIAFSGVFLLLPLPVPFSNGLPAATVLLLAAAAIERDGLCFLLGCGSFLLSVVFFVVLALGGVAGIEAMLRIFHRSPT